MMLGVSVLIALYSVPWESRNVFCGLMEVCWWKFQEEVLLTPPYMPNC